MVQPKSSTVSWRNPSFSLDLLEDRLKKSNTLGIHPEISIAGVSLPLQTAPGQRFFSICGSHTDLAGVWRNLSAMSSDLIFDNGSYIFIYCMLILSDIGSYFDPSKILTPKKGLKLLEIHWTDILQEIQPWSIYQYRNECLLLFRTGGGVSYWWILTYKVGVLNLLW